MENGITWTDSDYDEMSWHDNHVYGIRIQEGDFGTGTLLLELDYILEWVEKDNKYKFRIAPALLTFTKVFNLKLKIDYKTPTAAISPFSISQIDRENINSTPGSKYYNWTIGINWPEGKIEFEATGFTQILTGNIIETDQQILTNEQRLQAQNSG